MAHSPIHTDRCRVLNDRPVREGGDYVLYWMQQSQRADDNHALEYALDRAAELKAPVVVAFGLMDGYPEANLRHYRFLVEGLADAAASLAERGIGFVLRHGNPDDVALELAADACLVVCDRGYLRHQKAWRRRVAEEAACCVMQVESDVVVPVEVTSAKREWAARTLRPRFHRHREEHLKPVPRLEVKVPSLDLGLAGLDLGDPEALLDRLDLDRSVPPVPLFRGGGSVAKKIFRAFLDDHMAGYDDLRNQPQTNAVSHMSKYLHFGQVSPVWLALQVRGAGSKPREDRESYLEELEVRRELAMNFVHYAEADYDRYETLPEWARTTLEEHAGDEREYVYGEQELADAATHDPYWNAAMREMRHTGYMHNYMRMYWGKKILEWTASPEEGFAIALRLNNRYFLDGRDANSYTGVAWCFGLHDRAWTERPVFGKVRYMNAAGLERKCDPEAYVEKVDRLVEEVEAARG